MKTQPASQAWGEFVGACQGYFTDFLRRTWTPTTLYTKEQLYSLAFECSVEIDLAMPEVTGHQAQVFAILKHQVSTMLGKAETKPIPDADLPKYSQYQEDKRQ